eukprot:COSAG05_NODE_3778_length_1842_cov_1.183592_2_plen_318_part_00
MSFVSTVNHCASIINWSVFGWDVAAAVSLSVFRYLNNLAVHKEIEREEKNTLEEMMRTEAQHNKTSALNSVSSKAAAAAATVGGGAGGGGSGLVPVSASSAPAASHRSPTKAAAAAAVASSKSSISNSSNPGSASQVDIGDRNGSVNATDEQNGVTQQGSTVSASSTEDGLPAASAASALGARAAAPSASVDTRRTVSTTDLITRDRSRQQLALPTSTQAAVAPFSVASLSSTGGGGGGGTTSSHPSTPMGAMAGDGDGFPLSLQGSMTGGGGDMVRAWYDTYPLSVLSLVGLFSRMLARLASQRVAMSLFQPLVTA